MFSSTPRSWSERSTRPLRALAALLVLGGVFTPAGILTVTAQVQANQCVVPQSGLVGLWRADGSPVDSSPAARPGVLHDGVSYVPGVEGSAFVFDGTTGYVDVAEQGDLGDLNPAGGSFSLAAWVKSSVATDQSIVSKYECGGYCTEAALSLYHLYLTNRVAAAVLRDQNGGVSSLQGTRLVADGQFHHLALIRDVQAGELRLYVDGTLDASVSLAGGAIGTIRDNDGSSDPFTIGAYQVAGYDLRAGFFSGVIDDVALYSTALSDADVVAMAPAECGRPVITGLDVSAGATSAPSPVVVDRTITYVVTATNTGTVNATNVTLTNTLPSGATFVDAVPAPSSLSGSDQIFTVNALPVGGSASFVIHALAPLAAGTIVDGVHVSAAGDVNPANDSTTTPTVVELTACIVPPQGLVGLWRADDSPANSAPANGAAVLHGGVSYGPGVEGSAFMFDGTTGYVDVSTPNDVNALYPLTASFTLAAWVKTSAMTDQVVVSKYECGGYCPEGALSIYELYLTNGVAAAVLRDQNGGVSSLLGTRAVADGQFHHLVLVRDIEAVELRLYVDGTIDASVSLVGGAIHSIKDNDSRDDPFTIGAYQVGGQDYRAAFFAGAIDDVALFSRALSDAELLGMATPDCGRPPIPGLDVSASVTASPNPVGVFGAITYVVTATNAGTVDAANVTLTNTLPPGVTFVDAVPAPSSTSGGDQIFTVNSLPVGGSASFAIHALAPLTPGPIVDEVSVSAPGDSNISNDTVSTSTAVQLNACPAPPAGLTGSWHGDGSPVDSSPANRQGVAGSGVSYGPGVNGSAFVFDGTTGYVDVAPTDLNDLFPGTGSFSVAAWVKSTATVGFQTIVSKYECGGYCPNNALSLYDLHLGNGKAVAKLRDTNGIDNAVVGTRLVADGQFHHLVLVRDMQAFEMRLYVDGTLEGSASLTIGASGPIQDDDGQPDAFVIGAFQGAGPNALHDSFFNGAIDEVAYYSRALSDADVLALRDSTSLACTPVNHAPVAVTDSATTLQDTATDITVLANDTDADGDALTVTNVTQGTHGATISITGANAVHYVPAFGLTGTDTFTYTITDGHGGNATAAVTVTVTPNACVAPPTDGLVGVWHADGSPVDSSPAARPGVEHGGVSYGPGVNGSAFVFDGTTGYVDVPTSNDNELYPQAGSFSLAALVKSSATTAQVVAEKYECGGNSTCPGSNNGSVYQLSLADGVGGAFLRDTNGSVSIVQGVRLVADGQFHHLVVVRDIAGGELRLYVDGTLDALVSLAGGATGAIRDDDGEPDPFTIGAHHSAASANRVQFFNGAIGEVALYDRALTSAEVLAMGAPVCTAPVNHAPIAVGDSATTLQDTATDITVLANDTDADGDALTVTNVTQGTHGATISITGANAVHYVPAFGFTGTDTFTYTITDGHGGSATANVTVTVQAPVQISIGSVTAAEGNSGTTPFAFVVTLSSASALPVTVNYATADGTATTADHDYNTTSGTLTFAPGQTTQTVVVDVTGDTTFEPDETFTVTLSSPTNATIANGTGAYTMSLLAQGLQMPDGGMIYRPATNDFLVNEEFLGHISRVDASTGVVSLFADVTSLVPPNPGGALLYDLAVNSVGDVFVPAYSQGPVLRFDSNGAFLGSFPTPGGLALNCAFDSLDNFYIVNGTSIYRYDKGSFASPNLYASGFVGLASIRFNAADQLIAEDYSAGKIYQVTAGGLTAASHLLLATGLGKPDSIAIEPGTQDVFVGDDAAGAITRITSPGVFPTVATGIGVAPPTPNAGRLEAMGFDTAGNLYVADKFGGAIWKFTPPTVATATGTITNDDTVPVVSIGSGLALPESDSATTSFPFVVTLSGATALPVTVNYTTADGTATTADHDYTAKSGTLTFAPGDTFKIQFVEVTGDRKAEADETFTVTLSSPINATLGNATETITILNDESGATTTTLTATPNPGTSGQAVTLTATVAVAAPGIGTPSGTLTFADGTTTLGTTAVAPDGTASYVTTTLGLGTHALTAAYRSTNFLLASQSPVTTVTINLPLIVISVIEPITVSDSNLLLTPTTTVLTASPAASAAGQAVTFTATISVAGSTSGAPTGTVTFMDGGVVLGTTPVIGSVATFVTTSLTAGAHAITATYGGDAQFHASTGSLTQTVTAGSTTVSLTATPNPGVVGQNVTLTARVTVVAPAVGPPSGTVTFADGSTTLGTVPVALDGTASFVTTLALGTHSLTAGYSGTAFFQASQSPVVPVTINLYPLVVISVTEPITVSDSNLVVGPTTTVLTASPAASAAGQAVTFTATISVAGPTSGAPTGTVTFMDGSVVLGTTPVIGSVATFVTTSLTAGAHAITATYGGDAQFHASSGSLTQTVTAGSTTTTLTATPNPGTVGQNLTLTARVTVVAPAVGPPFGTVTFADGVTTLGTVPVAVDGTASFVITSLAVGTHSLTATYSGTAFFQTSLSPAVPVTISLFPVVVISVIEPITVSDADRFSPPTTTVLTASPGSSTAGQPVTFTATVSVAASASGTPTGIVTFTESGVVLGTAAVNGSVATFGTASLAIGSHIITATYDGDGQFQGSAGSLAQTVTAGSTTTTLTASPTPSVVGQSVTLAATVSAVAPASGTPTGTVTFQDGGVNIIGCAAQTVTAHVATCVTSALSVSGSPHAITARYGGDAQFLASATGSLAQIVNPGRTTTTLTASPAPSTIGQSVTLTATVSAAAPASGAPTGTVTFYDGFVRLGTTAVNAAVATFATTSLAEGFHAITVTYSGDAQFQTSAASLTHTVTGNTPTGANVVVTPIDATTGGSPVSLTFSNVTQGGITSVTSSSSGPPPPSGFKIGTPPVYFDISTTATFSGSATVCIDYTGISFKKAAGIQLLHFEKGAWVNRTASVNAATHQICATVTSFSPFTIVEPINQAPVLTNPGDQTAAEGQPVSLQLAASDPDADPLTFSVTGLPPGLHAGATGLISGTPTDQAAGVYAVTVSVSDGELTATQSFRWTVIDMSGRMTGEGHVAGSGLDHHFEFTVTERKNGADHGRVEFWIREVDTPKKRGKELHRFNAATITAVTFSDDPGFTAGCRARPPIDTVAFSGSGRWNGKAGYTFDARATDQGEPGAGRDTFAITIRDPGGAVVVTIGGTLAAGNIQSVRLEGR